MVSVKDHPFKDTIIQVFYWSHVSMAGVESDSEGKAVESVLCSELLQYCLKSIPGFHLL